MDDTVLRAFEGESARRLLLAGKWGIEREALRVDPFGRPAPTDHPFPPDREGITVDFGESQIEFVTRPRASADEALEELEALHAEAYRALGSELLWPLSVPGRWDEPTAFRPARFGEAPDKEEARRYREYLLARYGRARQAISGVHFNFSFSAEFRDFLRSAEAMAGSAETARAYSDRRYMDLTRNVVRYRFLPVFLFSASPSIDPRFEAELAASADESARKAAGACRGRTASLRLGPLGYRLDPERGQRIDVRFASLEEYLDKLEAACRPQGDEAPLLRSASEYYAPIRPKALPKGGKGSLDGLRERGVEYLELRLFDNDPFEPAGIGSRAAAFAQAFALACLLMPSPPLEADAAADDRLSFYSSACSYDWRGDLSDRRLRRAIAEASKDLIAAMERIVPLLGPAHRDALDWAEAAIAGKKPRSAERFARLALLEGGGLAAGLRLAAAHKRSLTALNDKKREAS
jgi:glutamate--cysteine ligase